MGRTSQQPDLPAPAAGASSRVHRPVLMLVSGLPGVGKSALIEQLAPRLGAASFSRDEARLGLHVGGLRRMVEALAWRLARRRLKSTQRRAGRILESVVAEQLENNRSVIVEAVAEDALRRRLDEISGRYGAAFVQVECALSDGAEHRRRLGLRSEGERFWCRVVATLKKRYKPPADCVQIETQAAPEALAERLLALVTPD